MVNSSLSPTSNPTAPIGNRAPATCPRTVATLQLRGNEQAAPCTAGEGTYQHLGEHEQLGGEVAGTFVTPYLNDNHRGEGWARRERCLSPPTSTGT